MKHLTLIVACSVLLCGCASNQLSQLQTAEQEAEKVYAATTQATADAQSALANAPAGSPATQAVAQAQKAELDARSTLDLIETTLNATQGKDANASAIAQAISAVVATIPSPWTALLTSLIPAAVPLVVSVAQSAKLGKVQQTVQAVTQELQEHKAVLAALGATTPTTVPGSASRIRMKCMAPKSARLSRCSFAGSPRFRGTILWGGVAVNELKTDQLETIRRLLLDPLREAVRQEIRLSHQSLAASLTKLNDRFDLHAADYQRRITRIEQSVAKIKLFRDRIVMIYGMMAFVLSIAWAILRERVMTWMGGR